MCDNIFFNALASLDAIDNATELNCAGLSKWDKRPDAEWRLGDEAVCARVCLRYRRQLPADIVAAARAALPPQTPAVRVSAQGDFSLEGFCPRNKFGVYLRVCKTDFRGRYNPDNKCWRIAPENVAAAIELFELAGFVVYVDAPESEEEKKEREAKERKAKNTIRFHFDGEFFRFVSPSYNDDFNRIFSNVYGESQFIFGYDPKDHARTTKTVAAALDAEKLLIAKGFFIERTLRCDAAIATHAEKMRGYASMDAGVKAELHDGISLFNHQNMAVEFLEKCNGNALLGACMGSGKTLMALAYAAKHHLKVMVIAPKVMRRTWVKEAKKFFPSHFSDVVEMRSIRDKKLVTGKTTLISTNYESAAKYADIVDGFDLLVVDESHYIKSPKAKRTKEVQELSKKFKHKILLSGTAVKNNRYEILPQLQIIDAELAEEVSQTKYLGDFWHALQNRYLSMSKAEVLAFLPAKRMERNEIEVDNPTPMPSSIEEITKFKHDCALSKVDATCEFIAELLESSDENILVFSEFRDVVEAIHDKFKDVSILHHGQLSDNIREAAKEEFQKSDSSARIFVSTRPSLAVGATLTRASRVVFNDLPWSMADVQQAEDRTHRIGQLNPVVVHWVVAENSSFDSTICNILEHKFKLQRAVTEGKKLTAEEQEQINKPVSFFELIKKS